MDWHGKRKKVLVIGLKWVNLGITCGGDHLLTGILQHWVGFPVRVNLQHNNENLLILQFKTETQHCGQRLKRNRSNLCLFEANDAKRKNKFLVLHPVANQKPEVKRSDKHTQQTETNVNYVILGIGFRFNKATMVSGAEMSAFSNTVHIHGTLIIIYH
jgi:hypothetical protein